MPTEPIPQPKPRDNGPPSTIAAALVPIGTPREIGPYQIQRLLGSGGMATVYAALQKQPRRTVALKVMKAGIAQSRGEAALRRFKREIEILGKLHHPFIAAVYDAGTFDDGSGPAPYFVMEYIPGATTILEYIAKKEMNLRDRLKLFVKVCAAVEHGHTNKVIHRDLKPGNILIDQYGEPKVIDFGIAHAAEVDSSQQTMATEAGNLVGTLQYMAPEQVDTRPQDLDGRCDVYALGVLLYKMTTGKPPYDLEALPVFEAIRIIREELPRRPSEINPEVKGDLETVILKAIEHDRARRYRNAGSLGRDIVRFLANKPINARRASVAYRSRLFFKRNSVVLSVIGVIALVAAAALGYTTWERQRLKRQQAQSAGQIREKEENLERRQLEIDAARAAAMQSNPRPAAEPFTLSQHTSRVTQLRFVPSANGSALLASASSDHQLLLWNLESRAASHRIDPLGIALTQIAIAADGSIIAVAGAGEGDPIAIVRSADGEVIRTLRSLGGAVRSLALSAAGQAVAWGAGNLTLNARATEAHGPLPPDDPQREPRSARSSVGVLCSLAYSMDQRLIAAGAESGTVLIWDPRAPAQAQAGNRGRPTPPSGGASGLTRLNGLTHPIVALTFVERDGARWLIAVAEDGSAFSWWNDANGWIGAGWNAAAKDIICAAFNAGGTHLVVATADGVQVWSLATIGATGPQRIGSLIKADDSPTAITIDDAGEWIALGMLNGDVRILPTVPKGP